MIKLLPWFELKRVPGIGNHLYKRLIDIFKSPENVFSASKDKLISINGVSPKLAEAINRHKPSNNTSAGLKRVKDEGYQIITLADADYPPLLKEIPDPPPMLYVYGKVEPDIANLAVVGSREATDYGKTAAKRLCRALADLGIAIVSGMAVGIDTAAHQGALDENGKTIAVLGCGIDRIYPSQNKKLYHKIAQNGAVITEFDLGSKPDPHHFPMRNRIISGMSLGTVVVEAASKSGSLITARLAAEQNREVFAVPGNINSKKSAGTHALIKQGAKLVHHIDDILEEFSYILKFNGQTEKPKNKETQDKKLSEEEYSVIKNLGPYPLHIDDITRKTSLSPARLSGILLQLELSGIIQQTPGKYFCLAPNMNI